MALRLRGDKMANSNDVLRAIENLTEKLYGKDGFEGDIEEIKASLKGHDKRISRNSRLVFTMLGMLLASGAGYGLANLIG